MASSFPHHTSEKKRQSTVMFENVTSVTVPASRFWMPMPRLLSLMMQLVKSTRRMLSMFSDPILMAHEREVIVQLLTTTSSQGPYCSNSRRFFRQMQSSPDPIKQFAMRTSF